MWMNEWVIVQVDNTVLALRSLLPCPAAECREMPRLGLELQNDRVWRRERLSSAVETQKEAKKEKH